MAEPNREPLEKLMFQAKNTNDLLNILKPSSSTQVTRRGPARSEVEPLLYLPDRANCGASTAEHINWGGIGIALQRSNLHFLIAGVPGTGKTMAFQLLLESVFSRNLRSNTRGNDRAIVYDPKRELYPFFRSIGVEATDISVLNPFDQRCSAWDLAVDYETDAEAMQLAKTIIPVSDSHSQPFFPKSAVLLLAAVVTAHMKGNPRGWDLADVIQTCLNLSELESFLGKRPWSPTIAMALNVLKSDGTKHSVFAELMSHLFEYSSIAARWRLARNAGRRFSVKSFVESRSSIALLGSSHTYSESLQAINRLLIKRLSEITLDHIADGQWQAQNRTWVVLDELRELGKVTGLSDLINKGRSRGVCAVLGFQDYVGLKHSFGEHAAHEIVASCGHKIILKMSGDSAEWASKMIGRAEIAETHFSFTNASSLAISSSESSGESESTGSSYSVGGGRSNSTGLSSTRSDQNSITSGMNHSVTTTTQVRETDVVLPSEISHLPGFDEGRGLNGFFCERAKVHRIRIPKSQFEHLWKSEPVSKDDVGYQSCGSKEQDLGWVLEQGNRI